MQVFKFLRPILRAPDIKEHIQGRQEMTEEEQLKLEYSELFESEEEPLYQLQIFNNLRASETGIFYNSKPTCEFCGLQHKDNCDYPVNTTIAQLIEKISQTARPSFVLSVCFRQNTTNVKFDTLNQIKVISDQ